MSLITKIEIEKENDIYLNFHDFLSDDADWDAEHWLFLDDKLFEMAEIIKSIYSKNDCPILFSSIWAGDTIAKRITLSIDEFISTIMKNKIETKSEYLIK